MVHILGWVPEGRERALACWTVCKQWNRLLRDTAAIGWTCVECNERKRTVERTWEAAWFRALVSDSVHVCFECAFELRGPIHLDYVRIAHCWKCTANLHGPMLVVNWRCYDINNVEKGALGFWYATSRTSVAREFSIRFPRCVLKDRCYEPGDARNVGLMFSPGQMLAMAAHIFVGHPPPHHTYLHYYYPSTGSLDKWNPD